MIRINVDECEFEDYDFDDASSKYYYFTYPEKHFEEFRSSGYFLEHKHYEAEEGVVHCITLRVTALPNGVKILSASPTCLTDDGLTDVDWYEIGWPDIDELQLDSLMAFAENQIMISRLNRMIKHTIKLIEDATALKCNLMVLKKDFEKENEHEEKN